MFLSHTSLKQTYPSTNTENVRSETLWVILFPDFIWESRGFCGQLEIKVMFLKSHLREQAELFLWPAFVNNIS